MIPSYVIFYTRGIPIHGSVSSSLLLLCKHELFEFELCHPRYVIWTSSGYVVNNTTIVLLDVIL